MRSRRRTPFRPQVVQLDARLPPSIAVADGVLTVAPDSANTSAAAGGETEYVTVVGDQLVALQCGPLGTGLAVVALADVKRVVLVGGAGNDSLINGTSLEGVYVGGTGVNLIVGHKGDLVIPDPPGIQLTLLLPEPSAVVPR